MKLADLAVGTIVRFAACKQAVVLHIGNPVFWNTSGAGAASAIGNPESRMQVSVVLVKPKPALRLWKHVYPASSSIIFRLIYRSDVRSSQMEYADLMALNRE